LFQGLRTGAPPIRKGYTINLPFVTTWNTENAGSATKTIVIPCTGSGYDAFVDWGDGSAPQHIVGSPGNVTYVYATTGIKTISIRGLFPRIYFNNAGDKLKLLSVLQWGTNAWTSMNYAFSGCLNLTIPAIDAPNLSVATDLTSMLAGTGGFGNADLSKWDVSHITNMKYLFYSNTAVFTDGKLDNWDVRNVQNFEHTFYSCYLFNGNIGNWNTISATNMGYMFAQCHTFNRDISRWNTGNVTSMTWMFYSCYALTNTLNIWKWNVSKVTDLSYLFYVTFPINPDLSAWDIRNVTTMANLFYADPTYNKLTTANYDAMLIAWSALAVKTGVHLDVAPTKYSAGAAATARGVLTGAPNNWVITDGGQV
jgi:surface protein